MAFAEIIQSSLEQWRAHSWDWRDVPEYGSLVMVSRPSGAVFGVVHAIEVGSLDSSRSPFPYKMTEEELLSQQPHIFAFLATTFSAITVGYTDEQGYNYQLAAHPPRIHGFVERATERDLRAFFSSQEYLHLIFGFSSRIGNVDELLLAIVKRQFGAQCMDRQQLHSFIKMYSLLLGNDYKRLKVFLGRVQIVAQAFGIEV